MQRVPCGAVKFADMCDLLGLKQPLCQPTRGENILDLVLTRCMSAHVIVRDDLLASDHK